MVEGGDELSRVRTMKDKGLGVGLKAVSVHNHQKVLHPPWTSPNGARGVTRNDLNILA